MASRACFCLVVSLLACSAAGAADPSPPAAAALATITDSASGGGPGGGIFFVLAEVDGKPVANAIDASQRASIGRGAHLRVVGEERQVAAGTRVKLRLVARVAHAAPIGEIFAALRNDALTGVLDVELRPGGRYRVNGMLDPFRREVWLEEEDTRSIVGEKFAQAPPAQAQAQMAEATSFACCNLHYDDDWIGDGPYTGLPFVPAGARIRFVDWGRYRANVLIEGRKMSIGVDFARQQMTREEYARKIIVDENPGLRIATWPAEVQAAVRAGKVMPGMTREQVVVSLGYPRLDLVRSLDATEWPYWAAEHDEYTVVWGDDGKVKSVEAALRIKRRVMPAP